MNVFAEFLAPSWAGWRQHLARLTPSVREFYAIVGRGAGKSRIVALIACWFATREYRRVPGEFVYIGVFAPDRKQAGVTFRYVVGLLKSVPALAVLIVAERSDSVELSNGVIVEVLTASVAAPRGRAYVLVIVEEAAFLPTDQSANPDVELLRAVRPALARVPGSLLAVVSSPYARRGVLYTAWQRCHGKPDSHVVLLQAPTLELNPTFDRQAIATAYEEDPASAAAEYGAEFRSDVESFITREALDACVIKGRLELPRIGGVTYGGFLDFAGGGGAGGDSAVAAVAHAEEHDGVLVAVLDALREIRPPFSPEQACADFASFFSSYGVAQAVSDRWAGQFPIEGMRRHGIAVEPSARPKSDIYKDFLPLLNSGRVELLDHPRILAQLAALERRTARGGRDSVDHPPGSGHDDISNAAAGVLCGVTSGKRMFWDAERGRFAVDYGLTI
jgi:hypothetical protein